MYPIFHHCNVTDRQAAWTWIIKSDACVQQPVCIFSISSHFNSTGRELKIGNNIMKAQKTHMEPKKQRWNLLHETERGSGQRVQVERKSEMESLHSVKLESCYERHS